MGGKNLAFLLSCCRPHSTRPRGQNPCHMLWLATMAAGQTLGSSSDSAPACDTGTTPGGALCLPGQASTPGSSNCSACGAPYDRGQRTARTPDVLVAGVNWSPRGIDCTRGLLRGTLPGFWSNSPLTAARLDRTITWECLAANACIGGFNSSCAEGRVGILCAACSPGYYINDALPRQSDCKLCPDAPNTIHPSRLAGPMLVICFSGAGAGLLIALLLAATICCIDAGTEHPQPQD